MKIEATSITLIKAISGNPDSIRWYEFVSKYKPMFVSYLQNKFPSLDYDDIIQETLLAITQCLPNYKYVPELKGHFHTYLIGILKHKAIDMLKKRKRISTITEKLKENNSINNENATFPNIEEELDNDKKWQAASMEIALQQLFLDDSINKRNREIFRHLVIFHESPIDVAEKFNVSRGNVDVIKKRMISKLSEIAHQLLNCR